MNLNAGNWIALVALLISIVNLYFNLRQKKRDKPVIEIDLSQRYSSFVLPSKYISDGTTNSNVSFPALAVSIRLRNVGFKPTTLNDVQVYNFDKDGYAHLVHTDEYDFTIIGLKEKSTGKFRSFKPGLAPNSLELPLRIKDSDIVEFQIVLPAMGYVNPGNDIKLNFEFSHSQQTVLLHIHELKKCLDSHNYTLS